MLIRDGTQRLVDEVDRTIQDSLMVVEDVVESPSILAGGGDNEFICCCTTKRMG